MNNHIKPDSEYCIVYNCNKLICKGYELLIELYGLRCYYFNGKRHRENAPAVIWPNSYQAWFIHGKLHNLYGPATTWKDGEKEYYIDNIQYSEFDFHIKQSICYICNYQANSKEDYLIHADKEMENGKVFNVSYLIT